MGFSLRSVAETAQCGPDTPIGPIVAAITLIATVDVMNRLSLHSGATEQFTIRDLSNRSRTCVNQMVVPERPREYGDEIRIGRSVFAFLTSR